MSPTTTSTATTSLQTAFPKLSIRTQMQPSFDYIPSELLTPMSHVVSPFATAPSNYDYTLAVMGPKSRFTPPDPKQIDKLPLIDPPTHLAQSLKILVSDHPPSAAATSVPKGLLSGPTSIAYLFLNLSKSHSSLDISTRTPAEWCREYLRAASTAHTRHPHSRAGGIQDEELAYACVKAAFTASLSSPSSQKPSPELTTYVQRALTHISILDLSPSDNEWLSGRAGTLYLLRMLKHWVPAASTPINTALESLVSEILTHDREESPWSWHGKQYLGAAHGDIGIITQCVLSMPSCIDSALTTRLSQLVAEQLPSGNWPASRRPGSKPSPSADELLQFCHGAPGIILSLLALSLYFPSLRPAIDSAVKRGRDAIWARGMLTKEPCVCHGIIGNAAALDRVRRERMLRLATPARVAEGISRGEFTPGSDAYGLLWGEAGRAWCWAAEMGGKGEGMGRMVGYTDV